jgi:hypothetical protein
MGHVAGMICRVMRSIRIGGSRQTPGTRLPCLLIQERGTAKPPQRWSCRFERPRFRARNRPGWLFPVPRIAKARTTVHRRLRAASTRYGVGRGATGALGSTVGTHKSAPYIASSMPPSTPSSRQLIRVFGGESKGCLSRECHCASHRYRLQRGRLPEAEWQ